MNTTINDIAVKLNLTAATVSRALNNHPRISANTKKKVLEAAAEMNYRRNNIASSFRTGKSHAIGVIIPSARINFFGSIVHGIETLASEYGFSTLIYQSEERAHLEAKAVEAFLGARVDGILASHAKEESDYAHFLDLKKGNVPVVFFDRVIDSLNFPSVVIDDFKGGFIATEHLIRQGYKRIAHLSGPPWINVFQNRLKGYLYALTVYGLETDVSLIYNGNLSVDSGKSAAEYFMGLINPPDAVFCVEDFCALGLLKYLKEKNIKVPEEIGIIGFANEEIDEFTTPTLSSIDQQTVEMGREAFKMLLRLIENKKKPDIPSKIILDPLPFYRESSMRNKMDHPVSSYHDKVTQKVFYEKLTT